MIVATLAYSASEKAAQIDEQQRMDHLVQFARRVTSSAPRSRGRGPYLFTIRNANTLSTMAVAQFTSIPSEGAGRIMHVSYWLELPPCSEGEFRVELIAFEDNPPDFSLELRHSHPLDDQLWSIERGGEPARRVSFNEWGAEVLDYGVWFSQETESRKVAECV
ncbi:hypothetical protein ACIBH1_45295 [Nonomuraea sp. NPDC050663]|uniref:hypothetical protein n=1 Tax=Nonomuraea sp. NPDC050663 TaxID=3364370 RepID=UPI003788AB4A